MFDLYKGKTSEGNWVYGNLVYSEDVLDDFRAIIIPTEENYQFSGNFSNNHITSKRDSQAERDIQEFLGFKKWYKVDINTVEQVDRNKYIYVYSFDPEDIPNTQDMMSYCIDEGVEHISTFEEINLVEKKARDAISLDDGLNEIDKIKKVKSIEGYFNALRLELESMLL